MLHLILVEEEMDETVSRDLMHAESKQWQLAIQRSVMQRQQPRKRMLFDQVDIEQSRGLAEAAPARLRGW